jgi:hypothetical protein
MPTPLMKSFAKQTDKKPKTVEKLWKKAERLVKKKYEIDDESSRFYPLVVGVLKNFLGIGKDEVNEDEGGEVMVAGSEGPVSYPMGTTTSNMGDYVFASKVGTPAARLISGQPLPVEIEIKKRKTKVHKKHNKKVRAIKESLEEENMTMDDAFSDMIKYYCESDSSDPVEDAIEALSRFFGIAPTIFDDIK